MGAYKGPSKEVPTSNPQPGVVDEEKNFICREDVRIEKIKVPVLIPKTVNKIIEIPRPVTIKVPQIEYIDKIVPNPVIKYVEKPVVKTETKIQYVPIRAPYAVNYYKSNYVMVPKPVKETIEVIKEKEVVVKVPTPVEVPVPKPIRVQNVVEIPNT